MIVIVKGGAVGMSCDQRCELDQVFLMGVYVRLLGKLAPYKIALTDIVGLELSDHLGIRFEVTGTLYR